MNNNDQNLDESRPTAEAPTPSPDEIDRQAEELAETYRELAKAATAPIKLSFGKKSGKLRRNSPCPCNSGRKYKVCCMRDVDRGKYKRLDIDGPIDPERQPSTKLGPSRGVVKYVRRKIAEQNAAANKSFQPKTSDDFPEGE